SIRAARDHIREHGAEPPPAYLRSSTRSDGGYDNPHRRPGHVSSQELLPPGAVGARFYEPDEAEAALRERLAEIREARGRAAP
ncbi:MAG: replication-associated recombination protein A, partial [Solirubrobacteraceae bacterium]